MTDLKIIAMDTETGLMGPDAVIPPLMCATFAQRKDDGNIGSVIFSNHPDEMAELKTLLVDLLEDDTVKLVYHNNGFDLTVVVRAFPDLMPLVFEKLEKGLVTDTKEREKLIHLGSHGQLGLIQNPDGSTAKIGYKLSDLVLDYLGLDRSGDKEGDDIWRLNYEALDGFRSSDYPEGARAYALQDAEDTLRVYYAQEARGGTTTTEEFQAAIGFPLRLQTAWGMLVDPVERDRIALEVEEALTPEKLALLHESGVLRRATPPRPHARGAKDKDGNVKMTAGKKESVNKKRLAEVVVAACAVADIPVTKTPKDGVSTAAAVLTELSPYCPILKQYEDRQELQKLVTTYLPALQHGTVHPEYDVIKATGRTSSFGGNLYPSLNIQQVDPRVRGVFVPRPGHVFLACDYTAIDLAAFAQTTYNLFGYSVHRDKINAGVDLHTYLGAVLLSEIEPGILGQVGDADAAYQAFLETKGENVDLFDKRRKFAKPPGLGYPGGMGPKTMVGTAKAQYGIELSLELAERIREIWLETYPEAREFFRYLSNNMIDPLNVRTPTAEDIERCEQEGRKFRGTLFRYESPLGMVRAGADYCAAANGFGLQTPAAEGAKSAVFEAARACYDWTRGSILFGSRPVAFIHDELILEIPEDDRMHERSVELERIMVECMGRILPDVTIRCESSLMRRWDKRAKNVLDSSGRLAIWEPSVEQTHGKQKDAA